MSFILATSFYYDTEKETKRFYKSCKDDTWNLDIIQILKYLETLEMISLNGGQCNKKLYLHKYLINIEIN